MDSLESVNVGTACGGKPDGCCIREDGLDYGFEGEQDGLFILAPGCSNERFQELQVVRGSAGYFRDMGGEGEQWVKSSVSCLWAQGCC